MGRIEEALTKSRGAKRRKKSPISITEAMVPEHSLDISSLPVMVPDQECLEKYRVVAAMQDAQERTAYKILRTRVLQRLRASQFNVIGITGAGIGEGKSLTAINFAYSIAQDVNHQVILADLDLRRPSLHEYLGISPPKDLSDVLDGSAKLEDVLVCPNANRIALLTNQSSHRDSSEILASPEPDLPVEELRSTHDYGR